MTNDESRGLVNPSHGDLIGLDNCEISTHLQCSAEECEIKRVLSKISEGQVNVTILGAKCSLIMSTIMALAAFFYHLWCVSMSLKFELFWWELVIVLAPFGGVIALKVKEQIPWKTEE